MGKNGSTGKMCGIERGVAKHRIRSESGKGEGSERLVFGIQDTVYFSMARKCFEFWFHTCTMLYLTPFTRTTSGKYVQRDRKGTLAHFLVWLIKLVMLLHKLWGLGTLLLYDDLKIETFLCACQVLTYLNSFSMGMVMLVRPKETMDLLNSWTLILFCLKQCGKAEPTQYDELSEALKVICLLTVTQGAALASAMFSLIFSTLPTCYFPTAERLGLLPNNCMLPRFVWQLIFFPLEYAAYLAPMLCAPFGFSMLLIFIGVCRIYTNELR